MNFVNNMTLLRFDNNGLEVFVDSISGETFASIRGYARMAGKNASTISRRVEKGVALNGCKTAQVQTAGGAQGVALLTEDFIAEWLPKDNPEMATQVLKLGVRLFIQTIANFKAAPSDATTLLALELKTEMAQIKAELEKLKQQPPAIAIPDYVPLALNITELPTEFMTRDFMTAVYQWMYDNHCDMSQAAAALKISRSYMRRLLNGFAQPNAVVFCQFATLINRDPYELLKQFLK